MALSSTVALILLPASRDAAWVQQAYDAGCGRGYGFAGVMLHDWPMIDFLLQARRVNAVVMEPGYYFADRSGRSRPIDPEEKMYETARLLPRGDDGGFAERFLKDRAAGAPDT